MPRRCSAVPAGLVLGLAFCIGCQARIAPPAAPGGPRTAGIEPNSAPKPAAAESVGAAEKVAAQANLPARAAPVISPEAFTITADAPGLQLLASRDEGGSRHDLTGLVQWTLEPPGLAEIEPGGYLRPRSEGVVTVRATFEGQAGASRITLEPRTIRSWDFTQDIVPVFTRLGCNTGSC